MICESAFHSVFTFNTFLRSFAIFFAEAAAILLPGLVSISSAKIRRTIRFVPFEDLKLRKPSERLLFPSFYVIAKYCGTILPSLFTFFIHS